MKIQNIALSLVGLAMLGGCVHPNEPLHHSFGKATADNMRAQIIDPASPGQGPTSTDGTVAADAVEAYTKGSIADVKAEKTASENK